MEQNYPDGYKPKKRNVNLLSLFDGSGGWCLASEMVGITPKYASEIEKFPIEVTKKNFPNMVHLGDVKNIHACDLELPLQVVTFGSPCQDLSVANVKRDGLAGERSGLFMEAVRIIKEINEEAGLRSVEPVRFAIWENVPGAYSSNKGEDFRVVLEELAKIKNPDLSVPGPANGKWQNDGVMDLPVGQIAWRSLDAQYWGVPQRRKRIFLVTDFTGRGAAKILFERKGLHGDSEKSEKQGQGSSGNSTENLGKASEVITPGKRTPLLFDNHPADSRVTGPVKACQTLSERMGTGGGNVPLVIGCQIKQGICADSRASANATRCKHPTTKTHRSFW